jgi:hypothetical protein
MTIRSIDLDPDQRLTSEGLPPTRRSLSVFGKDRKDKFTNNDQSSSSDDSTYSFKQKRNIIVQLLLLDSLKSMHTYRHNIFLIDK